MCHLHVEYKNHLLMLRKISQTLWTEGTKELSIKDVPSQGGKRGFVQCGHLANKEKGFFRCGRPHFMVQKS